MDDTYHNKLMIEEYLIDINNYKLGKKIRKGFSNVYKCINVKTNKIYAAKIFDRDDDDDDKQYLFKFYQEVEILLRCKQPTIVQFIGYSLTDFEKKNNAVIIMECASGSLHDLPLSDFQKLTYTQRQIILIGIARGMMILHNNRVIHRDLNLDDILIDDEYHPLISGFNNSKKIDNDDPYLHSVKNACLIYRAPEVDSGFYDIKADVYSFGIIMYEIVTGKEPYLGKDLKNPNSFMNKVKNSQFRPSFDNISINPNTKELISKCWSQNPNDRPSFEAIFKSLANLDNTDNVLINDDIDISKIHNYVTTIYDDEKADIYISDDESMAAVFQAFMKNLMIPSMKKQSQQQTLLDNQIAILKSEKKSISDKLDKEINYSNVLKSEKELLTNKLNEETNNNKRLRSEKESLENMLKEETNNNKRLRAEKESLEKMFKDEATNNKRLRSEKELLIKKINEETNKNKRLKSDKELLINKLNEETNKNKRLIIENENYKKQLLDANNKIKTLQNNNYYFINQLSNIKQKLGSISNSIFITISPEINDYSNDNIFDMHDEIQKNFVDNNENNFGVSDEINDKEKRIDNNENISDASDEIHEKEKSINNDENGFNISDEIHKKEKNINNNENNFDEYDEIHDKEKNTNNNENGFDISDEINDREKKIDNNENNFDISNEINDQEKKIDNNENNFDASDEIYEKEKNINNNENNFDEYDEIYDKEKNTNNNENGFDISDEINDKEKKIDNNENNFDVSDEINDKEKKIDNNENNFDVSDEINDQKKNYNNNENNFDEYDEIHDKEKNTNNNENGFDISDEINDQEKKIDNNENNFDASDEIHEKEKKIDNNENKFDTSDETQEKSATDFNNDNQLEFKDIEEITIKRFNCLALELQKSIISTLNSDDNTILKKIDNFLSFLLNPQIDQTKTCFEISTINYQEKISKLTDDIQLHILPYGTEKLIINESINKKMLNDILNQFDDVRIDIIYPSDSFKQTYQKIVNIIDSIGEKVKMSLIICNDFDNNKQDSVQSYNKIYSLHFSDTISDIKPHSFEKFASLKYIYISPSIEKLGYCSFGRCSKLEQVIFEPKCNLNIINSSVFIECKSLKEIIIPLSVSQLEDSNFKKCSMLSKIVFQEPSKIKVLKNHVFAQCSSLTQIRIPSSVTKIGVSVFEKCSSLVEIIIPPSTIEIGNKAFFNCSSLQFVRFGPNSSLLKINESAFSNCISLTDFQIPSLVNEIGSNSFKECKSLKNLLIPTSVRIIGKSAFAYCEQLKNVSFENITNSSLKTLSDFAFYNCPIERIEVPINGNDHTFNDTTEVKIVTNNS